MFFNLFQKNTLNNKIGYEDVLYAIENNTKNIIINTLEKNLQHCLIKSTLSIENETIILNQMIENNKLNEVNIILYGLNSVDNSVEQKYKQLIDLGFPKVYIYSGGMFEWLLMQDIYSKENFPTTSYDLDILKYKPRGILNIPLIGR
jgi:hypothetical protein